MVFDKPRLPGVQVRRGGFGISKYAAGRRVRQCASSGAETQAHPIRSTERGIRNARHVDLSEASSRCYLDPRSGTELVVAA